MKKAIGPTEDDVRKAWDIVRQVSKGEIGRHSRSLLQAAIFLIEQYQGKAPERGERRMLWPDGADFTETPTVPDPGPN